MNNSLTPYIQNRRKLKSVANSCSVLHRGLLAYPHDTLQPALVISMGSCGSLFPVAIFIHERGDLFGHQPDEKHDDGGH